MKIFQNFMRSLNKQNKTASKQKVRPVVVRDVVNFETGKIVSRTVTYDEFAKRHLQNQVLRPEQQELQFGNF